MSGIILAVIGLICIIGLAVLYRHIPNHKIYFIFLAVVIVIVGILVTSYRSQQAKNAEITNEQKAAIQLEQQAFTPWYDSYKKHVEQLDYNWQRYQQIVADFKADNISIEVAHLRLEQVSQTSVEISESLSRLEPPMELKNENYDLTIELIKKIRDYSAAQQSVIKNTYIASDPLNQLSENQPDQANRLEDIMIRESPTGLFTANEILQIRNNLLIKDDIEKTNN